jgi:REP element-mobilizing transposase RayT
MKRKPGLDSFRRNGVHQVITAAIKSAKKKNFRIVHFSIQADHLHMLIEADSRDAMVRGMRGLGRRLGHHLNKFWKRTGSVFAHRFHERILTSFRQVRNVLRYVLNNHHKHGVAASAHCPDPLSSGKYFDGWSDYPRRSDPTAANSCVSSPGWQLSLGWKKKYALIAVGSKPGRRD